MEANPPVLRALKAFKDEKSGDYPVEFYDGVGLKTVVWCERKSWIGQVLISRTLSVCGEVAERLKAAVC